MSLPHSIQENANTAIANSERWPRAILIIGFAALWGGIIWLVFDLVRHHFGG